MSTYIVTVTAADRVGIVYSVSGALRDQQGNILELSQTVLRGYFTIILAVAFPDPRDPRQLAEAISEAGKRFRLTVSVIEAKEEVLAPPASPGERFILTVLGPDRPGSIHGIAGCLASHGVNIVDLHARVDGEKFSLVMEAFLPADLAPGVVRAELERFGRDLGLDVYVQHENIFLATSEPSPVRVAVPNPRGDSVVPH